MMITAVREFAELGQPSLAKYAAQHLAMYAEDHQTVRILEVLAVLKLNPNLLDVNVKLAELHQQLGLMSEAMAYFQIVANAQDKAGDTKASLDTLKKNGSTISTRLIRRRDVAREPGAGRPHAGIVGIG